MKNSNISNPDKVLLVALYETAIKEGLDQSIDPFFVNARMQLGIDTNELNTATKRLMELGLLIQNRGKATINRGVYFVRMTEVGIGAAREIRLNDSHSLAPVNFSPQDAFDRTVPIFDLEDGYSELQNRIILEISRSPDKYERPNSGGQYDFTMLIGELGLDIPLDRLIEVLYILDSQGMILLEEVESDSEVLGFPNPTLFERGRMLEYILARFSFEKEELDAKIPASDRIVDLSDNRPEVKLLRGEVEALDNRMDQANDLEGLSDQQRALIKVDIAAIKQIVNLKTASATVLSGFVLTTLVKIGDKLSDVISSEIVNSAISALKAILGI